MLQIGSQVKENQALVAIGDLSGISTTAQVSELVINKIKPGQKVTVSLDALPNITIYGTVKSVGAQAQPAAEGGGPGGIATFPVTVIVPTLTPQQANLIRVGMTSKIQITIENPAQIMIPINAVYQKGNISMVKVIDAKGKSREVPVVTGQTTLSEVAILQGLKPGDRVVIPSSP
jgi:hypothetical protein